MHQKMLTCIIVLFLSAILGEAERYTQSFSSNDIFLGVANKTRDNNDDQISNSQHGDNKKQQEKQQLRTLRLVVSTINSVGISAVNSSSKPTLLKPIQPLMPKPTSLKPIRPIAGSKPMKPIAVTTPNKKRPSSKPVKPSTLHKPIQVHSSFKPTLSPTSALSHIGQLKRFRNELPGAYPLGMAFGSALSLSDNGQFLAAGDFGNDQVHVYRWSSKNSSWVPYGKTPVNVASQFTNEINYSVQALAKVVLSGNGNVMAVNGVLYRYQSNQTWAPDNVTTTANPFAGSQDVSFSSDLSIGALPGNTTNLYHWNGKMWTPYGPVLHVASWGVSLSSNGSMVALQTPVGRVKVFRMTVTSSNGTRAWVPVGEDLPSASISTLALSGNGLRLVLVMSNQIKVYQYTPTLQKWIAVGYGATFDTIVGLPLIVSNDGNVVTATTYSLTRVFQVTNATRWNQIGNDLTGYHAGPYSVAMSADGHVLASSYFVPSPSKFPVALYTYEIVTEM